MHDPNGYQNNPLHGISLKTVVTEIANHYGFEILYAYLHLNCFKTKPSIDSSVKFLKKTDWAREKVESFYLYQFKSLPRASEDQFRLPPRERIIPMSQQPGAPAELSLEDAERLHEKRAKRAAERSQNRRQGSGRSYDNPRPQRERIESQNDDPWAKWR